MTGDEAIELVAKAEALWDYELTDEQRRLWVKAFTGLPSRHIVASVLESLAMKRASLPRLAVVMDAITEATPKETRHEPLRRSPGGPSYIEHIRQANPSCGSMGDAELVCRCARARFDRHIRDLVPGLERQRRTALLRRELDGMLSMAAVTDAETRKYLMDAVCGDDPIAYGRAMDWLRDGSATDDAEVF